MNNKTTITKWFSMLLLMLVAGVSGAVAQSLTISEFAIAAGETKDVAITLTPASGQTIYGVQTDVVLSEGLTLTDATKVDADLSLSWNDENNRLILLSISTTEQKSIAEGDIITLSITAADDFEGGTVKLSNSRLTTSKYGSEVSVSDCEVLVALDGPVDMTNKVLTDGWQSNMAGNVGKYTKDVEQAEHYNGSTTELLDDVLYQMVGDLPNGTYTVELYANASYTPDRGFASKALDGELGRVIVYAVCPEGNAVSKTIPVVYQTSVSKNNIVTLENVVVTNGVLRLGLGKIAPGSNWHTIQIKSLTQTSEQTEVDKAFLEAQNTYWTGIATTIAAYPAYSNVDGDERTNLENAEGLLKLMSAIPPFFAAKTAYDAASLIADDADGENIDFTSLIVNPSFELGNTNGWNYQNSGDRGAKSTSDNTYKMTNSDGNYLFNIWDGEKGHTISQTIATLPSGRYKLQAVVATDSGYKMQLKANDNVAQVDATGAGNGIEAELEFNLFDGQLTISADATGNRWYKVDNFRLTFVKAITLEDCVAGYHEALEEAGQKLASPMNADAKSTLEGVVNDNSDVDESDIDALIAATTALQEANAAAAPSIAAYAAAKAALDAMKAVMDGTNVYTADAYETYNGVYTANLEKYNAGTLTDDEAKAIVNPSKAITWGERSQEKYGDAPTFLLSSWEPTFPDFSTYYINTWSVEGDTDGSGFSVPFFEYFTGAEASLAEKTLTATVEDLENGLYKVTAWVRVETVNDVDATDATGVTLAVNDGEEADVTEGTQIGETLRSLGTFEAQGLVKDGTLYIKFNVASDNNIHWLSFKNVKYEKVRDLTEEEMAVKPTSVTFDEETITLTATSNTVTLTPSYTPDEATATFNWTSSDESVATVTNEGVVTGVAPGTATITVTSTLDEDVWATCEVTVSYPESTIPETVEIVDETAMTKSVYTLSQTNLFKNGSFEYPNRVYGWKATNYSTDAVASNFTFTETGGVDNGAYITTNAGGAGAATSIRQAARVESGKTYYFAVSTSGKAPASNNFQYNALFKMNSDGTTENGVLKQFEWPQGAEKTSSEWSQTEYVFTADESIPYVGVRMSWNSSTNFDNFVLVEAIPSGVYDLSATADDYAALNEAIEAAPTLGFLAGEAAPYNNVEEVKDLAAAKAIDPTVKNLATTVQELTATLNAAKWVTNSEEVNAIYDGDFNIQIVPSDNTRPLGWARHSATANSNDGTDGGYETRLVSLVSGVTKTDKGMMTKHHAFYGDQIGYQLPLKADTYYTLSFKYCGWNEQPTMHINVYGEDGTKVANSEDFSAKDNQGHNKAESWQEFSYTFKTGDAGNYVIGIMKNVGGTTQSQGGFTDINLVKTPETSVTLAVTDAKWATFVAPFDVEIPAGVTAYIVDGVKDNELKLTLLTTTTIEANKPVVLNSDNVVNETVTGVAQPVENPTAGWLTGVYAETAVPEGSYVLQNHEGSVAFYVVDPDVAVPNVQANHAYMTIPSGDGARAYYLNGEATAISTLKALTSGDAEIYDVNGRRQLKLQKGVNIIRTKDGRTQKVMVK